MTDDQAYFKSEGFLNLLKQYEASVESGQPIYMDADDLADIAAVSCSVVSTSEGLMCPTQKSAP